MDRTDAATVARLEGKIDRIFDYIRAQENRNKQYDHAVVQVNSLVAGKKAIVWMLSAFGGLTVATATLTTTIMDFIRHGRP
jgi:hypothetical protein